MLRHILGLFRGSGPATTQTQLDELKRSYNLEKVASSLPPGSPSDERSSSALAVVSAVRHASKDFRSPMWDVRNARTCASIVRQMSTAGRARANLEHIALVHFIGSRIGEVRGMSHTVLDLAYTKFISLLAERGLLRSDSDLQALDGVVASAFQEYQAEFSREDGPGPHYWLDKAAARRILDVDTLTAIVEFGFLITEMTKAIGATLDEHTEMTAAE